MLNTVSSRNQDLTLICEHASVNIYKMTFKERTLSSVPQGGTNHHHASFRAKYQKSETISEVTQKTALERTLRPVPRLRMAGHGVSTEESRCVPVGDQETKGGLFHEGRRGIDALDGGTALPRRPGSYRSAKLKTERPYPSSGGALCGGEGEEVHPQKTLWLMSFQGLWSLDGLPYPRGVVRTRRQPV